MRSQNDTLFQAQMAAVSTAHEDGVLRLAIEGNIAAGKSTFLQILAKELNFLVVPEPLSKWQSVNADTESFSFSQKSGGNLLEMFYSDAKRWAYTFQSYAFLSRYASTILVCGTSTQYRMRAQLRPFEDFESASTGTRAKRSNEFMTSPAKRSKLSNGESKPPAATPDPPRLILRINSDSNNACSLSLQDGDNFFYCDQQNEIKCSSNVLDVSANHLFTLSVNDTEDLTVLRACVPLTVTRTNGTTVQLESGKVCALTNGCVIAANGTTFEFIASPKLRADTVLFFERSVLSDRFCFAQNCFASGLFNETEWECYKDWHSWLLTAFNGLRLDGIVYLQTTPDVCFQRLAKRARSEENTVTLEYLESLHDRHEQWLHSEADSDDESGEQNNKSSAFAISFAVTHANGKRLPVLTLHTDQEFETDSKRQEEMLQAVRHFITQLHLGKL